jgi:ureidoglycolate lyase
MTAGPGDDGAAVTVEAQPITADAFAPFGEVIEPGGTPPLAINDGLCERFTDLARLEAGDDGRIAVSLFRAGIRTLPYRLALMERHPEGSQCFVPLDGSRFLVTVAPDIDGAPGAPLAFLAGPDQPVNIARNVWHGVLTPVGGSGLFLVLDRLGPGRNLEEHRFRNPVLIR